MFRPNFQITPGIANNLMAIESARQTVSNLPMDAAVLHSLYESAKLLSTHYSTRIEGNRLTQAEVADAIQGARFPGRERDEKEVRNYYDALDEIESLTSQEKTITESVVKRLHGISFRGVRKPTPYRDGQNVIRDSATGGIVYMPPEAADVPTLMNGLVAWFTAETERGEYPVPIIAALAHYQFATIHPYYDGNGRVARLLTTLILHKCGYGLNGIYSLEEYYARDLPAYYEALDIGPSHNYYEGRADADCTPFVEYFCAGMRASFESVRAQALAASERASAEASNHVKGLGPRERRLFTLFVKQDVASTKEIAKHLGLGIESTRKHCRKWLSTGILELDDPSKKNRTYRLGRQYR